jgi:hypothetical protein
MEVSKIGNRRERADITAMMLGLSRCTRSSAERSF